MKDPGIVHLRIVLEPGKMSLVVPEIFKMSINAIPSALKIARELLELVRPMSYPMR